MIIENDSIKKLGSELKLKIIELVKKEQIDIVYTYKSSFRQIGHFYFEYIGSQIIPKNIVVPKLIDSELTLAIIMAHELGHYYAYKKNPRFINKIIIGSANSYVIYQNEKRAWKEAKCIIESLGYWQGDIPFVFETERSNALRSYQPRDNFFNYIARKIFHYSKYWLSLYLMVSLFYLLSQNGIPIPFISHNTIVEINREDFFSAINGLFYLFIFGKLLATLMFKFTKE
ncbi:hypothetical protein [Lysinibacillus fusiformis]|uniref:hypothetical protein n=1 Tax=Lysinibacillus fusiformis TaxID=28031 RepID=UPI0021BF1701|nr:hypothetical protein [Lysinibacillus fusiformis]UXJ71369.1 hypothetical protein N5069_23385 [Lysinibacillus fusiformis]